jgi:4a-hydroxytetrahydrobiopterin dehydratase
MNELANMHCTKITKDTPQMGDNDIQKYIAGLPGWQLKMKDDEPRIEKVFAFKDFDQAAGFTMGVARKSKEEDHHPAILTEWGKVTVSWWTHKIKGLHLNDFIMAAKTEQLYQDEHETRD